MQLRKISFLIIVFFLSNVCFLVTCYNCYLASRACACSTYALLPLSNLSFFYLLSSDVCSVVHSYLVLNLAQWNILFELSSSSFLLGTMNDCSLPSSRIVLYVWPGQWSLPSFDPQCLAALLYLQLAIPGQFTVAECSYPDLSPTGKCLHILLLFWRWIS